MKLPGYRKLVIDRQIALIHVCHTDLNCRERIDKLR